MTAFQLAQRFVGELAEFPGSQQHPFIQWAHMLCRLGTDQPDEVPWCSSFVNAIAWMLRLPRSKSAAARSWLGIGATIHIEDATADDCVVILKRGTSPTAGHVGFYAGHDDLKVFLLGGNQGNNVSIASFMRSDILGVRKLL